MSARCRCGHHRLTHTYTRKANIGPCQGRSGGAGDEKCACTKYEEDK